MKVQDVIQNETSGAGLTARLVPLGALIGVKSWSDLAALLAAVYSLLLICEWLWKKVLRPFLERRGLVKRRQRRKEDLS